MKGMQSKLKCNTMYFLHKKDAFFQTITHSVYKDAGERELSDIRGLSIDRDLLRRI